MAVMVTAEAASAAQRLGSSSAQIAEVLAAVTQIAGQTNLIFCSVAAALPMVKAGRLRAIAVTTAGRVPLSGPGVEKTLMPTMSFDATSWRQAAAGLAARQAAGRMLLMQELRDRLLNIDNKGVNALKGSPP